MPTLTKVGITDYNFPGGDTMPDYKKMYLTLFRASEDAVNLLVKAQRECEELYLSSPEPELTAPEDGAPAGPPAPDPPRPPAPADCRTDTATPAE